MANEYKEYNNYSQQDKDSMRTLAADTSNANEATIIGQTDEVESLLKSLIKEVQDVDANTDAVESKLDTVISNIDGIEGKLDTIIGDLSNVKTLIGNNTLEVTTQGQAIVQAIQAEQQS